MVSNHGLTALEVLGVAIRAEMEAASLYAHMAHRVRNASLVAKLEFLAQEEKKHRRILEEVYAHQFPEVELQIPVKSIVPTVNASEVEQVSVPELFQLAMKAEQLSADFYSREADRSVDQAGRTVLRYLSNVERGHYQMLQTEYELLSQFPDYYNADEFHVGHDLMHIGP